MNFQSLAVLVSHGKGQAKSELFFQSENASKKRTNDLDFTTTDPTLHGWIPKWQFKPVQMAPGANGGTKLSGFFRREMTVDQKRTPH